LYRGASYGRLEKRFGQSFDEWREAKREVVAAVDRLQKVERRREELERRQGAARRSIQSALLTRTDHGRLRNAQRHYTSELDRELRRIYVAGDVARARQELVRQARRDGWRNAGRRLAQEPQQFGRVRGAGLGPVRNARRTSALRSADRIGRVAAELATVRAARVTLGPSAAKAIVRLRRMSRTAQRATAAIDRLPSRRKLELEVAKKAAALGVSLIHLTLAPNVLNVARAALRTVGLVREAVRGDYER
jgi:chromosome segregation ATPase